MANILEVENLTVAVGDRTIVDNVSFTVAAKSVTALVGGSGSGKTTTGLAVLRLLPPSFTVSSGRIVVGPHAKDLLAMEDEGLRSVRGRDIGMIFQEPLAAFNPVFSIGDQIEEVLNYHQSLTKGERKRKVLETLERVGLPDPRRVAASYPHQLSGGMRQRAMVAQAIVCGPSLLIADEPTSSLDVTLQARIMDLFRDLRREMDMAIVLITHDLGMVAHLADDVVVLQSGRVVEKGAILSILSSPREKYTQQLLDASL